MSFRSRPCVASVVFSLALAGVLGLAATREAYAQTGSVIEKQILAGVNALKASAADQQASLNTLQTAIGGQQTSLAGLQTALTALQTNVTALQTAVSSLQSAVNSIPRDPRKKYYLTTTPVDGASTLNACASGYHMASLWEIFDTSNLLYDTSLGQSSGDSGRGPSSLHEGWVRTGWRDEGQHGFPGSSNCDTWTSADETKAGTVAELNNQWDESPVNQNPAVNPWRARWVKCDQRAPVWCVQN